MGNTNENFACKFWYKKLGCIQTKVFVFEPKRQNVVLLFKVCWHIVTLISK